MGTLIVEKKVTMSELNKMPKPVPATKYHKPIPHFTAITALLDALEARKIEVADLEVGTSHAGQRCFWLAKLKQEGDYSPMIGGRNAHDRSVSYALYGGASIFICSNLMVSAKFEDRRKHMGEIATELPELVNTSIDRVLRDNHINRDRISYYKKQTLSDKDAYYFMVDAMKRDILGPSKIKYLVEQWEKPLHEEFSGKNAWSLHNCFTEIFKDLTSADLVYHRNTVLNGMMDDYTNFEKPIIDITPPKPKEVKADPVLGEPAKKVLNSDGSVTEFFINPKYAKLNSKKTKKKAKVNVKKATVTLTKTKKAPTKSQVVYEHNPSDDKARSERVDAVLAKVKKTK